MPFTFSLSKKIQPPGKNLCASQIQPTFALYLPKLSHQFSRYLKGQDNAVKLIMFIPIDDTKNNPFCRLQLQLKRLDTQLNEPTNNNSANEFENKSLPASALQITRQTLCFLITQIYHFLAHSKKNNNRSLDWHIQFKL